MPWISGQSGKVIVGAVLGVGGISLSATNWSIDWRCDVVDVSNFNGMGWGGFIDGVPEFDVRVDAIYETSENPFGLGVPLIPGNSVSLILHMDPTIAGAYYRMDDVVVIDVTMENAVRDTVRYSISGKSSAYYSTALITYPDV